MRFPRIGPFGEYMYSHAIFDNNVTGIRKVYLWYFNVWPDFRKHGTFSKYLQKLIREGAADGMKEIEFTALNVSNDILVNYFKGLESQGWIVKEITAQNANNSYVLKIMLP